MPCSARELGHADVVARVGRGWSSIQTMPSAATSGGSQSEWSTPGKLDDEAFGRDGHVDAERVDRRCRAARSWCASDDRHVLERDLRHAVRHLAREVVERGDRRHVEDRALRRVPSSPGSDRLHRDRAARARSTCNIRSKRFIGRSRSPGKVIAALLTRMSTAAEVLDRRRDHRLDLVVGARGSSAPRSRSPPASAMRAPCRRSCRESAAVRVGGACARTRPCTPRCRERDRGGGADAAARAGDDRNLARRAPWRRTYERPGSCLAAR